MDNDRLAQAWWDAGMEREKATEMAREARAGLRGGSGAALGLIEEIDAWLVERAATKAAMPAH